MKKLFLITLLFLGMQTIVAQTIVEKWKPFSEYHQLLSNTFHPSEEGDFGPIKQFSGELNRKAEALDITSIPKEFKTPKIESTVTLLKKQTKFVDELVKVKAPNAEIMRAFEDLHDIFHRIVLLSKEE
jgi:hypothetical protein